MDKLLKGKRVFDIEIEALKKTRDSLDDTFVKILDIILNCKGKVVFIGMGKPGHIARKLAATFSSLGTPAFSIHPAEALHGDLGMLSENDVVIIISLSGESDEIIKILPAIKMIGSMLIGITGNLNSCLAKYSDIVQILPDFKEACHLGLAPTSSTTVELCYGDALAVVASEIYGFQKADFAKLHPAGSLGKRIISTVYNLMAKNDDIPKVKSNSLIMDAIPVMTEKLLGLVIVVDSENRLLGLITDGDLRRCIQKRIDIYTTKVEEIMNKSPKTISEQKLAIDALKYMKTNNLSNLLVVDEKNQLTGVITMSMIIKAGIIL